MPRLSDRCGGMLCPVRVRLAEQKGIDTAIHMGAWKDVRTWFEFLPPLSNYSRNFRHLKEGRDNTSIRRLRVGRPTLGFTSP